MSKHAKISPFRLSYLLRLERNPNLALQLFRHPSPSPTPSSPESATPSTSKPSQYRYSAKSYDIIVCKLGKARMFDEMEQILRQMVGETRFVAKEALFCRVIAFYGRARSPNDAFTLFERIPSFRCRRTIRSFNVLVHAVLQCGDIGRVRELWNGIDDYGLAPDACTYNVLISGECLYGSLDGAWKLFDEMRERGIAPNVITIGTLVAALCANSKFDEAFWLKETMLSLYGVKPNVYVYTSLIKGLCKSGELDRALRLKDEIWFDQELKLDSAVYSTLIRLLFRSGRKGEVVGIMEEMKRTGVKPNVVTYNAMIAGFCEDERDFDAAYETLNEMVRNGCKPDVVSYNTMIAGYCKVGRWPDARELLEDMPRRECRPNVVSYRTLFDGMCEARKFDEARLVLEEMLFKGFRPRTVSVTKYAKGVLSSQVEDCCVVASTLGSLTKANAFGMGDWEELVCDTIEELKRLKVGDVIDDLIIG